MDWQTIRDILTSPWGSFASVSGFLWLAFYLTVKVTRAVTKLDLGRESFEKTADKIEAHIDGIRADVAMLKGAVELLSQPVKGRSMVKAQSPISLTEYGNEVAGQLQVPERINRNWTKIFQHLEQALQSKNAYDIQQYCMEKIAVQPELFFDKDDINAMKDVAFREGDSFFAYCQVIGILVRDRYLKEKGIAVDEVDQHDPNKK
jgi:hypothetical protein